MRSHSAFASVSLHVFHISYHIKYRRGNHFFWCGGPEFDPRLSPSLSKRNSSLSEKKWGRGKARTRLQDWNEECISEMGERSTRFGRWGVVLPCVGPTKCEPILSPHRSPPVFSERLSKKAGGSDQKTREKAREQEAKRVERATVERETRPRERERARD